MKDEPQWSATVDVPVEVAMVDGSKWIVYYRLKDGQGYGEALMYVERHIRECALRVADDADRTTGRNALVNMAYVVSVTDPSVED